MKCYANQVDGGICVSRQGRVLTETEFNDVHSLPDGDVCRHKSGHDCIFSSKGKTTKKEPVHEKDMFDTIFGE